MALRVRAKAARFAGATSSLGRGAHLRVALAKPQDEQGLQLTVRHRRGVYLCSDESLDGKAFGSLMRLFRRFLDGTLQSSRIKDPLGFARVDVPQVLFGEHAITVLDKVLDRRLRDRCAVPR